MKKVKNILVYGIIILLCAVSLGGWLINKWQDSASTAASQPRGKVDAQSHIKEVMSKELEELDPTPVVGVGKGSDFAKVTEDAVNNAGGLKGIVRKGDTVLIKPNLCVESEGAGSPMTTDYRVTQKVVDMVKELGASRIIIAEGNFNSNAFDNLANKYKEIQGVEFYNFNDCETTDCYELKPQKSLTKTAIFVPKVFMDADVVINVSKLKTHYITTVSLCLKNWIGVPSYKIYAGSGAKGGLHALGLEYAIIDLNKIRKPDFSVIDGIVGGEGYGPYANTPVNSNVVFAGRDPVALDTVALNFMGFSVENVTHVLLAGVEKLGIDDLSKIKVKGADLNSIKMKFKPAN